jgi:hypothetical protein
MDFMFKNHKEDRHKQENAGLARLALLHKSVAIGMVG